MSAREKEVGVVCQSLIMQQAELTSAKDENRRFKYSFWQRERQSEVSAEKKIMYEETAIDEMPAFFIESTKLKLCRDISLVSKILYPLSFVIRPTKIEENITQKYNIIPSFASPYIPAPMPEITKAQEGLLDKAHSLSSSFLLITPAL